MFAFYADETMTTPAANPLPVTYNGAGSRDLLLYFGSPNTNATLTPDNNAGATEVILTPADLLAVWAASAYYNVGDMVQPVSANGFMYRCTVAGTAAAAEPGWDATVGGATTSGTATFVNAGARFVQANVKLALSADGLASAAGGGGVSLGASVAGGAAVAVHVRMDNPDSALRNDTTDPTVGININNCIVTTTA